MVEMNIYSREIQAAVGSFDYVRLAPHSAQDDRHVGCERVQGVRRSINFRPNNSPPKRSLDGAPVYGHLTGARDGTAMPPPLLESWGARKRYPCLASPIAPTRSEPAARRCTSNMSLDNRTPILSAAPREYRAVAAGVQDGRSRSAVTWSLTVV